MKRKPFLSLVVPCYNSGNYITRLLQSVQDCSMPDIEVILSDDCSTEPYQDKVDEFKDKLNIIQCKTPFNSGNPTNARELGASKATGKYLAFMDHDDWMIPEGLKAWWELVEKQNYPDYIVCGFRQCDSEGNPQFEKYGCLDFLHGKFIKLDFYRKGNIHFKPDIFHKEDTWVCAQINCNAIKYNVEPVFTDFCTYVWHNNEKSLSHKIDAAERSGDTSVTIERCNTNIDIEEQIYFKFFDEGSLPYPVAQTWFIRSLINFYFDVELNHSCFDILKPRVSKYLAEIKGKLNMTNQEIIDYAFADDGYIFFDQLNEFMEMAHPAFEWSESFEDFIEMITQ